MEDIATWVAPVATTIAALMTASNLGSRVTGYGFIVFTIGSLAWLTLGITTGQSNLLWQNLILTALNLLGIWRWLGRQAAVEQGGRSAAQASEATPGEALFPVSLLAKARLIAGGEEAGTCVDAMAGERSGRLTYVVVSDGGLAGVGERLRRLDWKDARVDGDRLVANIDHERFCGLPELTKDQWPAR